MSDNSENRTLYFHGTSGKNRLARIYHAIKNNEVTGLTESDSGYLTNAIENIFKGENANKAFGLNKKSGAKKKVKPAMLDAIGVAELRANGSDRVPAIDDIAEDENYPGKSFGTVRRHYDDNRKDAELYLELKQSIQELVDDGHLPNSAHLEIDDFVNIDKLFEKVSQLTEMCSDPRIKR